MKIVKLHYGMFEVRSKNGKSLAEYDSINKAMKYVRNHKAN